MPIDPGSSIHTFTSSNVPKKDEDAAPTGTTPKLTRLERANRAIAVMEKRLKANKQVRERCGHLEEKLDQLNKDMDTAYMRIKAELTRAELGGPKGATSSVSASKATSVYSTDYTEKSELTPATSIPQTRLILEPLLEQRLSCMERSLKRLDAIESTLSKLTSHFDGSAARTTPSPKMGGNLYGCHDISEVFSQTQTELQRARTAISRMLTMPAIYSKTQTVSECIRDRSELDVLGKMIDRFLVKLQNSKTAYQSACCGDIGNCILCSMETTSSWISRSSLY